MKKTIKEFCDSCPIYKRCDKWFKNKYCGFTDNKPCKEYSYKPLQILVGRLNEKS